jgi:ribosomal-protein-alanine N-acetyltransferase
MRWWDIEPVMDVEHELFGVESWSDTTFWSELAERDTRSYWVVEAETDGVPNGDIEAYAGLCSYAPHEAYVQTIAVAPQAQGRGLGTALLIALLGEADSRGCAHVDLEVRADNSTARRLYERHGFHQIAVRRGYYQPSGTDAVVMRRELTSR